MPNACMPNSMLLVIDSPSLLHHFYVSQIRGAFHKDFVSFLQLKPKQSQILNILIMLAECNDVIISICASR